MTADHFRRNSESKVTVPGADKSAKGAAAALGMAALRNALADGASLRVTPSGGFATAPEPSTGQGQWLLVQSAGSTGAAKTIRRHPASWIASFDVTIDQFAVGAATPYAVLGALGHSLTLYAVLEALHLGADLTVLTGLTPRAQARQIGENRVQVLYATPTQLRLLCDAADRPLTTLRWLFCGGGKLDSPTRARLHDLFPNAELREFFGASETSFITLSHPDTPEGSVGRAYPGVRLAVRDGNGQETCGPGEIWVNSPYLFDSYAEGGCADTLWQDGYLSIGEMGLLDDRGNLTVLGRKNRMITVSDQNVFPEAVEALIMATGDVGKFAAIPVKDPRRGHSIVGIVEGPTNLTLAQSLLKSCRDGLGPHATPRRIVFVDDMPLLAAGKPDLLALQRMLETAI